MLIASDTDVFLAFLHYSQGITRTHRKTLNTQILIPSNTNTQTSHTSTKQPNNVREPNECICTVFAPSSTYTT